MTIDLFKKNQFLCKKSSNPSNTYISKNSPDSNLPTDIIIKKFDSFLHNLDKQFDNISFEQCSNRLKNVLYRKQIYDIQILKSYPIENIMKFENFGEKCLWELFGFLTKVSNNKIIETQPTNNKINKNISINDKLLEE